MAKTTNKRSRNNLRVTVRSTIEPSVTIASDTGAAPQSNGTAGPAFEEVARLAYFYWESRAGVEGSAEEDWLRAERELMESAAMMPRELTARGN